MTGPSPLNAMEAILPAGLTLQDVAIRLAGGVCEAYSAYNNGSNLTPVLSGYNSIQTIWVHEAAPNGNPFSGSLTAAALAADVATSPKRPGTGPGTKPETMTVPSAPAAYVSFPGAAANPCTGPTPPGTPTPGYQLFGFTATADDGSHNILIFRGTVTMQEAAYDLLGWGNNTQCLLPSQWWEQNSYGFVNSYLFAFYANSGVIFTSLAKSCMDAIQKTVAIKPNVPWFIGAHSLGGAMASLAALDAVVSKVLNPGNTLAMTFGSLHVGDQAFATAYNQQVPSSLRIANLCDFVPSMVSLEPVILDDPYVHVGYEGTFVWQTWDDWGNHSLANIYRPIVESYWNLLHWGPRQYPQ